MAQSLKLNDLRLLAAERLRDAEALLGADRYDGAVYMCGYVMELSLKARICETLRWASYSTDAGYASFKTHNLEVLLHLSGREKDIKTTRDLEWSTVQRWNPESRYNLGTPATRSEAENMIQDTRTLLEDL